MAVGTTNRITLRIGVVFDKAGLEVEASKVRKQLDGKMADSTKQQTKALKDQQKALTKRTGEMKKEKSILAELSTGWNKMVANFLKFTAVASVTMALGVSLKQMKDLLFELDTAMTNLSIVTGATASELAMVDAQASKLTTTLGALKGEVINSITEFARAGFDLADAMLLTERATMAANVGFTELDRITTFLIAGLKSFKLEAEDSVRVLDVLFRVANVTAIDLEGIGEAFLRSANTLKVAGATLEESASLIAAANESIQDPAKVGTALKTIASRLRGVGDEGEVVPTLAKDFEAVGIAIQNADGSFRNIYDVFEEFSEVYKNLDDLTKESLLEKLAGKRQKNIMIGLLENFDVAQMALEEAMNSAGAVALANEKYLDSLEGKTKILTETWGEFLRQLGDSEGLKSVIDFLTLFLKTATMLTNGIPGLITAVVGLRIAWLAFSAALATSTFGLNLLLPALAGVIGLISGGNGLAAVFDMASASTETLGTKLAEIKSTIADLDQRIANLHSLEAVGELTDAEEELLGVLIKQREERQRLADITQGQLLDSMISDFEKSQKQFATVLKNVSDRSVEEFYAQSELSIESQKKLLESYEMQLLSAKEEILGVAQATSEGSETNNKAKAALEFLSSELLKVEGQQERLAIKIRTVTDETEEVISAQQQLKNTLHEVEQLLVSTPKNYQLLSDAMAQMEEQGYLSEDMLKSIKEEFPELVTETGLAKNAFISMANGIMISSKGGLISALGDLRKEKVILQARVDLYQQAQDKIQKFADPLGVRRVVNDSGSRGSLTDPLLTDMINIDNLIAEVRNSYKGLMGIDDERAEKSEKSSSATTKEKEALSALERELRDVTQAIAILDKEYARATNAEEQLRINEELVVQYKLQRETLQSLRAELIANNSTIKQSDDGYDDYIDNLYKLDLQIEDVTNSLFNATKATATLATELRNSLVDELSNILRDSQKEIERAANKELDRINKLIDALDEEYSLRKDKFDLEKEEAEYRKRMAELEGDISENVIESQLLATDNSLESQRRRAELAEELVELNKTKTDEITAYQYKQEERRIEDEYKRERKALEDQAILIKDRLARIAEDTEIALEKISMMSEDNIGQLETMISELTNGLSIETLSTLGGTWDTILEKVKAYADALSKIADAPVNVIQPPKTPSSSMSPSGVVEKTESPVNQNTGNLSKEEQYYMDIIKNGNGYTSGWAANELEKLQSGNQSSNPTTSATKTPAPTQSNTTGGNTIGNAVYIDKMNNIVQSDYDVKRIGSNLAKGTTNVLTGYGYSLTDR